MKARLAVIGMVLPLAFGLVPGVGPVVTAALPWRLSAEVERDGTGRARGVWLSIRNETSQTRAICPSVLVSYSDGGPGSGSVVSRGGTIGRPGGACSSVADVLRIAPKESYSQFQLLDEPVAPGWRFSVTVTSRKDAYPFEITESTEVAAVVR